MKLAHFRVTNTKGEGVQAALGLQVVDEAVFAPAEKQPRFAKVFFYLEQEAMKPRYEIHSIGMPEIVGAASPRDLAARALFSATETVRNNKFETELGRSIPQTKYSQYAQLYQSRFHTQVVHLAERLTREYAEKAGTELSTILENIDAPEVLDSWDTRLRVEPVSWVPQRRYYMLRSAGPDKLATI